MDDETVYQLTAEEWESNPARVLCEVDGRHCSCWYIDGAPCCVCGAEPDGPVTEGP